MFSRDPTELVRKDKLSKEEVSRGIRLDLVAELDAINFYLQQSSLIPDGPSKEVYEDIAREEVAHFGEFMRLLYEYEPGDFAKIKEGWEEASELLSGKKEQNGVNSFMDGEIKKDKNDVKENWLPGEFGQFRIMDWDQRGIPLPEDENKILPLKRFSHEFSIKKGGLHLYKEEKKKEQLRQFKWQLNEEILLKNDLSLAKRSEKINPADWSKPGKILDDVIKARKKLREAGYLSRPLILVSPDVNSLLLKQSEDSGQSEIDLISEGVGPVSVTPFLGGYHIIVVNPSSFWILVGESPELKKIAEGSDSTEYSISSRISPLLYDRKAAISMEWKK